MPDITLANISTLLLSMQSQGKAHATCVKVYTILHSLFKMAYMSDVVPINPMDKVERPKPRKNELKKRTRKPTPPKKSSAFFPPWKANR